MSCKKRCKKIKFGDSCDKNVQLIRQCDLPLKIRKSGRYCVAEDLFFNKEKSCCDCSCDMKPLITIRAECVLLDLNGYCIDLCGNGFQGIKINKSDNVWIINGKIINSAFSPIVDVDIPPFNPLPEVPNVNIAAIKIEESSNIGIQDLYIDNVLYGIVGENLGNNISIEDCQVTDFGITEEVEGLTLPFGAGILLIGVSDIERAKEIVVDNCIATGPQAKFGICLIFVDRFSISNCRASASPTPIEPADVGAVCVADSDFGIFENDQANVSTHPFFSLRCESLDLNNFVTQQTHSDGIQMVFTDHSSITNCKCHRGVQEPQIDGSGIKLIICKFVTIQNCITSGYINGDPFGNGGDGNGIVVTASESCSVEKNVAHGNNGGIRDQLERIIGGTVFKGTPSRYYTNYAHDNLVQNFIDVSPVVDSVNTPIDTIVVPYVNIEASNP